MPVTADDITFRYSGGTFNQDKDESYGGQMSRFEIIGENKRNLFRDIIQSASEIGSVIPGTPNVKEYRVIYVRVNPLADGKASAGEVWGTVSAIPDIHYRIAVGPVNTLIAKQGTPYIMPDGLSFQNVPTSEITGINLQELNPGDFFAIGIERSITATTDSQDSGSLVLHFSFSDLIEELLMEFNTQLATGMTVAGYPNPNTLATPNPYPNPFTSIQAVSSAWTTQAKKLFFANDIEDGGGQLSTPILIIPTAGDATPRDNVVWSVRLWEYDRHSQLWVSPAGSESEGWTGPKIVYIYKPLFIPQYFQVLSVSNSGSLQIRVNNVLCVVA